LDIIMSDHKAINTYANYLFAGSVLAVHGVLCASFLGLFLPEGPTVLSLVALAIIFVVVGSVFYKGIARSKKIACETAK